VEEAGAKDVDEVRRHPGRLVRFSPVAAATSTPQTIPALAGVLSEALAEERRRAGSAVAELFQFFLDQPGRLPEAYRRSRKANRRTGWSAITSRDDGRVLPPHVRADGGAATEHRAPILSGSCLRTAGQRCPPRIGTEKQKRGLPTLDGFRTLIYA